MSIILRPYQDEIISKARELMSKGRRRILIQAPTGSGKTALTAHMMKTAASKGMTSWFMVHRRELIKQSAATFSNVGIDFGVAANGFHFDTKPMTHICSVQSMKSRAPHLKRPSLIIWDETHHIGAATWERIFLENPQAFHIGLTATPCRLDGKGLSEFYDEMILGPSTSWLIENKFLAPFKYFAPKNIDTTKLHTSMGDYVKSEVNELVTDKKIIGDAVSEYNKYCKDKRAVVFCASVNHSLYIRDEFLKHGIQCAHLDGEHDHSYRDQVLNKFTSGEIKVLCNVDLFGEGFDLPAIDAVIMLRPTQSLGLFLQQVGRGLRTFPGKDHAIILDHVGNWQRHGLPDDEREWSLAGVNRKKKDESEKKIKICAGCFAAVEYFPCSNCGQSPEPKKRGEIEQEDGELQEVSRDQARKDFRKQQGRAQTLQDLIELGRSRGYKRPEFWAKAVFNGRRNRI